MPILKPNLEPRPRSEAVVLDLRDLAAEAAAIRVEAQVEADRIRSEARAEAQREQDAAAARGYAEGRDRGRAEGFAAGRAEGEASARAEEAEAARGLQAAWTRALEGWEADRARLLAEARNAVVALALDLAGTVVRRHLDADPAVVERQVIDALQLVMRPSAVCLRLHPDDRPRIDALLPELRARFSRCVHITLRDDETVGRGGCIVHTEGGRVDARIDTQLQRLADALLAPTEPEALS